MRQGGDCLGRSLAKIRAPKAVKYGGGGGGGGGGRPGAPQQEDGKHGRGARVLALVRHGCWALLAERAASFGRGAPRRRCCRCCELPKEVQSAWIAALSAWQASQRPSCSSLPPNTAGSAARGVQLGKLCRTTTMSRLASCQAAQPAEHEAHFRPALTAPLRPGKRFQRVIRPVAARFDTQDAPKPCSRGEQRPHGRRASAAAAAAGQPRRIQADPARQVLGRPCGPVWTQSERRHPSRLSVALPSLQTCSRTIGCGSSRCSSSTRTRWCCRCAREQWRRRRQRSGGSSNSCAPPSRPVPSMQELKLLADDAAVYKMIGPALVRQEPGEAAANVGKRLEFIGGACLLWFLVCVDMAARHMRLSRISGYTPHLAMHESGFSSSKVGCVASPGMALPFGRCHCKMTPHRPARPHHLSCISLVTLPAWSPCRRAAAAGQPAGTAGGEAGQEAGAGAAPMPCTWGAPSSVPSLHVDGGCPCLLMWCPLPCLNHVPALCMQLFFRVLIARRPPPHTCPCSW